MILSTSYNGHLPKYLFLSCLSYLPYTRRSLKRLCEWKMPLTTLTQISSRLWSTISHRLIKDQIFCTRVYQFLIDNSVGLNIISFHVVQQLCISKFSIDPKCKTTIKAYDEVEQSSKGLIVLPIQVGTIERDAVF